MGTTAGVVPRRANGMVGMTDDYGARWGPRMRRNIQRIQHAAGVVTVFMALVVMGGWFARNAAVVQIYHEFAPMQFNTALGFLFSGMALCSIRHPWDRFRSMLGIFLILLGVASVSQYLFLIDLGIDELLMEPFTTVRTSHPGRMAPNTAVCFALTGVALLSMGFRRPDAVACVGAMIMALGLVSIFGYLSGVDSAYGWGDLTRMALHTSIGFVIVGFGLVLRLVDGEAQGSPRVISIVVALLSITCTLAIWQALLAERGRTVMTELHRDAGRAAADVNLVLGQTLDALERFAYRAAESEGGRQQPEHRSEDSTRYLEDFEGLTRLSWFDLQRGSRWTHDRIHDGESVPPDAEEIELVQKLKLEGITGSFSGAYHPATPGNEATMVFGIGVTGGQGGGQGVLIAVLKANDYFPAVLAHTSPAQQLRLRVGDTELFVWKPTVGEVLVPRFTATSSVKFPAGTLHLELRATRAFVLSKSSRMLYVVLFGGFLITGLLILSTHLAVRSWQAQEAFRHQYSRHRLVVNHLPAMIAAFDAENRLIFANAPFVALLGATSEQEILGGSPRELLGPYYAEISGHLQRVLAGDMVRYEVTVNDERQGARCLDTQLVPHRHAEGAVDSYYALVLDVTEQRESARRLEENTERLRRFTDLAIGREERMIALKEEVNQLLCELDRGNRYTVVRLKQSDTTGDG